MRLWPTRELTGRSIFGRSFATMGIATMRCAGGAARSVTAPALKAAEALDARRAHAAFWAGGGASDSRLIITASAAMAGNLARVAADRGRLSRQVRPTTQHFLLSKTELGSCGWANRVQERGTESWRRCGHSSCTNRSCAGSRAPCAASPPRQTSTTPCVPAPSRHAASPCLPFRARPSLATRRRRASGAAPRRRYASPAAAPPSAGAVPDSRAERHLLEEGDERPRLHLRRQGPEGPSGPPLSPRPVRCRPAPCRRPPSRGPRRWSRRRCAC